MLRALPLVPHVRSIAAQALIHDALAARPGCAATGVASCRRHIARRARLCATVTLAVAGVKLGEGARWSVEPLPQVRQIDGHGDAARKVYILHVLIREQGFDAG